MKNLFFISIIVAVFVLTSCQEQEVNIPGVGSFRVENYFATGEGVIASINPSNGLVVEKVSTVPSSNAVAWIEGSEVFIKTSTSIKEATVNFSWKNFPGNKLNIALGNFFKKPFATLVYDTHGTGYIKVQSGDLVPVANLAPKIPFSLSFSLEQYSVSLKQNKVTIADNNNPSSTVISTIPPLFASFGLIKTTTYQPTTMGLLKTGGPK